MPHKLGIIAGGGGLPRHLAEKCRLERRPVFLVLLEEQADVGLANDFPSALLRIGAAGKIVKTMKSQKVVDLVFAGHVLKPTYTQLRPDLWSTSFLLKNKVFNSGDNRLLSALIKALEDEGFNVVGADDLDPNLLCEEACITKYSPNSAFIKDINTGISAAMDLGSKDIGQAVVCSGGEIIAREDRSGTDALLAKLPSSQSFGGVLIKCAKPGQERRVDLPSIGPDTITALSRAGLSGIAVSAGEALVLERAKTIAAADSAGIFIIGVNTSYLNQSIHE